LDVACGPAQDTRRERAPKAVARADEDGVEGPAVADRVVLVDPVEGGQLLSNLTVSATPILAA
jgi:hypothetical protein